MKLVIEVDLGKIAPEDLVEMIVVGARRRRVGLDTGGNSSYAEQTIQELCQRPEVRMRLEE